jgi:phosphatidate cytidylyltransferase
VNAAPSPSPAKWADLGLRAGSAAVLIPAVLLDVWFGGIWFELFVALLCVLMAQEWVALSHRDDPRQFALHAASAMAGALVPLHSGLWSAVGAVAVLTGLSLLLAALQGGLGSRWAWLGVPYVGLPAIALVVLRADPDWGFLAIIWIMLIVWSADTLAYFAGRIIGGPKLAPVLSPKKTWAGLGGAVAGSAIASWLVGYFAGLPSLVPLALLAGGLAVVEQGGDLFKSAWKRHFGVKDSGRLIPGHGGVIDRVDGLVAVAMAAALIGLARGLAVGPAHGLLSW